MQLLTNKMVYNCILVNNITLLYYMIVMSIQLRTSKQYYITEAYSLYYYTAACYDSMGSNGGPHRSTRPSRSLLPIVTRPNKQIGYMLLHFKYTVLPWDTVNKGAMFSDLRQIKNGLLYIPVLYQNCHLHPNSDIFPFIMYLWLVYKIDLLSYVYVRSRMVCCISQFYTKIVIFIPTLISSHLLCIYGLFTRLIC